MLILGVDTSGKFGSIALAQGQPDGTCQPIDLVPLAGGTFSAQLVPQIAELLKKHGFSKNDLDGFCVASGPGSFTGLRVGLSAIKALAEVLNKPIAAVSLLEAIASTNRAEGQVFAAIDAGRNEVYVGHFEAGQRFEQLLRVDEFANAVRAATVLSPDTNILEKAKAAGARAIEVERPRGDLIARLGWQQILAGNTIPPDELEANYIRRSDAEIFSSPARS